MTAAAVIELLHSAPQSEEEATTLPDSSLFFRILVEAHRFSGHGEKFCRSVMDYFAQDLVKMPPSRRAMLGRGMGY